MAEKQDDRPITANELKSILPELLSNHVCTQKSAIELHTAMFGELRQALGQTSVQLGNIISMQSGFEKTITEKITMFSGEIAKEMAVLKREAELRHQTVTDLFKDLTGRVGDIEEQAEEQQLKIQDLESRFEHLEDESSKSIEALQLALKKLEAIMSPETIKFIGDIKQQYEANRNRWVTITAMVVGITIVGTGIFYFQNILVGAQKIINFFKEEVKASDVIKPETPPKKQLESK